MGNRFPPERYLSPCGGRRKNHIRKDREGGGFFLNGVPSRRGKGRAESFIYWRKRRGNMFILGSLSHS